MKAQTKVVLFARHTAGNKVSQHPVATFGDDKRARQYANALHMAYKGENIEHVKQLDPSAPISEDGKLPSVPKFAVTPLPYDPDPFVLHEDAAFEESSLAS